MAAKDGSVDERKHTSEPIAFADLAILVAQLATAAKLRLWCALLLLACAAGRGQDQKDHAAQLAQAQTALKAASTLVIQTVTGGAAEDCLACALTMKCWREPYVILQTDKPRRNWRTYYLPSPWYAKSNCYPLSVNYTCFPEAHCTSACVCIATGAAAWQASINDKKAC